MLINDAALVEQRRLLLPEERLLLAVVEAAYWDLKSRQYLDRQQAQRYFLSDETHHTFSFLAVCQHFGWSVDSIRFQLSGLLTPEEEAELFGS